MRHSLQEEQTMTNNFNPRHRLAITLLASASTLAFVVPTSVAQDAAATHVTGVFDDGQEWQISMPAEWNGVVINDLDSVGDVEAGEMRSTYFLANGYAYTGTRRHPDRNTNWDPQAESDNMVKVLDIVEERYGAPTFAIQFGCSGGGSVGLSVAEDHPDRFDGVISMHASTPVELANVRLDLAIALKALLDPEGDLKPIIAEGEQAAAGDAWRAMLEAAMETPEGRARMALAAAVAQYPMWGSQGTPEAENIDWNDAEAVEDAMVRVALDGAMRAVTGRPMWDNPSGVMSWTTDVDYHAFYANADEVQRERVASLYEKAGLDPETAIDADIDAINAWPRIDATVEGIEYFRARTHTGDIGVPVLHVSNIGDGGTPAVVMAGYQMKIEAAGAGDLYRQAFIDASGHCTYNESELAAVTETMMQRLETGEWVGLDPESMNTLGRDAGLGDARFIDIDKTGFKLPSTFNRAFTRETDVPGVDGL
jgi:pimeloyl-ACP methyl ester carboxylesterase